MPGVLPDMVVVRDDVEQVVGELEGHADALAVAGQDVDLGIVEAPASIAPNRPEVAISEPVLSASTDR